jgi:hypothetical protein
VFVRGLRVGLVGKKCAHHLHVPCGCTTKVVQKG